MLVLHKKFYTVLIANFTRSADFDQKTAFVAFLNIFLGQFFYDSKSSHNLNAMLFLTSLHPFEASTHISREFFLSGASRHFICRSLLLHPILLRSLATLFVLFCFIPYDLHFMFQTSQ